MSQINEALKRAKKSQKQQPPPLPPGAPPLPPVEPQSSGSMGWLVLIILIIAIACFFIGLAFATRKPSTEATVTVTNVVQAAAAPVPVTPKPALTTNLIVPPPKPAPPTLKLEGILYGPTQPPQAIVNGQTVYVGDTVNGFRVKMISKNDVSFIASDGTEKNLVLGE
jgi:hypothetical protein